VNKLPQVSDDAWRLDRHAHLVVYDADDGGELLTIYDCGAAQKPPSAQIVGTLAHTDTAHERTSQPTGYIVTLKDGGILRERDDERYVIEAE
jgi:hypothetical protein